jgi:N-acetylglucosamine kinase-like BadF-type ATPase
MLRFNAGRWLVAGVDVGGAKILAMLSDLDGNVLGTARRRTPAGRQQHKSADPHEETQKAQGNFSHQNSTSPKSRMDTSLVCAVSLCKFRPPMSA